ncbi:heavy-metal-associated domain-containing protein [Pelomonas sp. CA6]|uniref:heavy-metal-associated domain-containing protein n=1 Tax=Pelomonas sp. CA6 TaxID=2907999 RepID=UPI001F4C1247|nr:heavy-metal-associated domain-containing protein [Pelomonas sp. CA6]MCH7344648.1 heavy-metal-associated domain-containing protein [Pelomonas sp. CA6]
MQHHEFTLPDMSCGRCVAHITEAVKEQDDQARLDIQLAQKKLVVDTQLDRAALAAALTEAGYPPAS